MKNTSTIVTTFILTALVVGGGVYLWQQAEKQPVDENIEVVEEPTTANEQEKMYNDEYLSFEYPQNVDLLFAQPSGGRSDSQTISFLVYDETNGAYKSTQLSLSYMTNLGESETSSFDNLDDLLAFYQEYDLETNEFTVDGRQAVQIITGDMSGETFFLAIPANESGDAYVFRGTSLSNDVNEIIELFMETAVLNQ